MYYLILVDLLVISIFLHATGLITVLRFKKDYNSNIKPSNLKEYRKTKTFAKNFTISKFPYFHIPFVVVFLIPLF